MKKSFTFTKNTIISVWSESALIHCQTDRDLQVILLNQHQVLKLMLPCRLIILISREGLKTLLSQKNDYPIDMEL